MSLLYELRALFRDGSDWIPVHLLIWQPEADDVHQDFYCRIRLDGILKGEKKIHGQDAEQAIELSKLFVQSLLEEKTLIDENGGVVNFTPL